MPRPTMDVNGEEYRKILKGREYYRLFGQDYEDMLWVDELLDRLEKKDWFEAYSAKDRAEFARARQILDRVTEKFNPSQPRVPAGNPDGGQWTRIGGGSGGSTTPSPSTGKKPSAHLPTPKPHIPGQPASTHTIDRAAEHLEQAAHDNPKGWCARYVREALEAGGVHVDVPSIRPGEKYAQARDYGTSLKNAGFEEIVSEHQPANYPPSEYTPRKGDVAVIQSTSRNKEGHMAMHTGKIWISDYKQWDFWPGRTYRLEKPSFAIYRLPQK